MKDYTMPERFMHIAVVVREGEDAVRYRASLEDAIKKSGDFKLCEPGPDTLLVLVGGDGFLLETAAMYTRFNMPVLGINFGNVGFFMNPDVPPETILSFLRDPGANLVAQAYALLEVRFRTQSGKEKKEYAFNEVFVERVTGQSLHLCVEIDGEVVNVFSGDGILVATAQGSTGWALGMGGPAIHPDVPSILVVPHVSQRSWKYRSLLSPMVYPLTSTIGISNRSPQKRPAWVVCDGKKSGKMVEAKISASGKWVHVLRFTDPSFRTSFTQRLVDKIIGPPREE